MRLITWAPAIALGVSLGLAQNAVGELKIAVVDAETAIGQSEEAQQFVEKLQQELATERTEIEELQASIQELQKRVTDEGDVMSETEQRNIAKELEDKGIDLDFRIKKYQKSLEDRQGEFLRSMGPKFQAVLDDLIKLERYDFVFARRSIVFGNMRHDITAKVTEKLNEKYVEPE